MRSADTGLWARAGVSVRGGVVVDVSMGATRTAVLRAWLGIRAWVRGCVRGAGDLLVGSWMCTWGWGSPCGLADVHVSPFTGSSNPFMRSWTLLMALRAACLDCHLWG